MHRASTELGHRPVAAVQKDFVRRDLRIVSLGIALVAGAGGQPARSMAQTPAVEIPFELVNNRVHVPVSLNGQGPFDFMLDLGAWGMGRLDDSLRTALDIPVTRQEDNFDGINSEPINVITVESLALGAFVQRGVDLLSRNYPMQGIIGQAYFEDHLLTIDYPRQVLRVSDGSLDTTDAHTVQYDEAFHVPVRIGDTDAMANIDTGSSLTMVFPMTYADRLETTPLVETGVARRANTEFRIYSATLLEPLVIAGNTLADLEVVFAESVQRINVGSGLLRRFALAIDQRNQRIRLAPSGS